MKKTTLRMLGVIFALVLAIGFAVTASAASALDSATPYTLGTTIKGNISEDHTSDTYKISIPASGMLTLDLKAEIGYVYVYLYDENGKEIWNDLPHWNNITKEISLSQSFELCGGNYYFSIARYGSYNGDYSSVFSFVSANESFTEPQGGNNNKIQDAVFINEGIEYKGHISMNDETDIYKLELASSGLLSANIKTGFEYVFFKIYDASGKEVASEIVNWNSVTQQGNFAHTLHLNKGTYYFTVSKYGGRYFGNYTISYSVAQANESFPEEQGGTNNNIRVATDIELNYKYNGQIALFDDTDFYRFTVSDKKLIALNVRADIEYLFIKIYDENGEEVFSEPLSWNDVSQQILFDASQTFNKGVYYLSIVKRSGRCGNYMFSLSDGGEIKPYGDNASIPAGIKVGTPIGQYLYTDIVAYINNKPIRSFNVDGNTMIVVEDLQSFGLYVSYDNAERKLSVEKGAGIITSNYRNPGVDKWNVGKKAGDVVHTDIVTYVNGKKVASYNISGFTIILFDDLVAFGKVNWNGTARRIDLTLNF